MTPDQVDPVIATVYHWLDLSGVLVMGTIGGTIARQRGYDIVGFLFIAMVSALGGGMLRDLLINEGTVAAMKQPEYLILAFTGAVIARFTYFKGKAWEFVRSHGDALISALWASVGAFKAITYGLPVLPTILMGVLTATGGSMIRDVLTGREPSVFGDNQPTVVPAIAGAVVTLIGVETGNLGLGAVLGPLTSFSIFLVSYYRGWKVPTSPEFAPVNTTVTGLAGAARKVAGSSRNMARRFEPDHLRSWRQQQLSRAFARRATTHPDTPAPSHEPEELAREVLNTLDEELPGGSSGDRMQHPLTREDRETIAERAIADIDGKVFGFDKNGDSYVTGKTDSTDSPTLSTSTDPSEPGAGVEPEKATLHHEILDLILADDELTDELVERLAQRLKRKREGQ